MFYVPADTKQDQRRSSSPVSWLSTEDTKPNTTKANYTGTKWQKHTETNLNLKKTKTNSQLQPCVRITVYGCRTQCSPGQLRTIIIAQMLSTGSDEYAKKGSTFDTDDG